MNNGAMKFMYKFLYKYLPSILSRIAELYGTSVFNFLRELHTVFHRNLRYFVSLVIYKHFSFSISSPTFTFVCHFEYRHPRACEVASHFGFDFKFLTDA